MESISSRRQGPRAKQRCQEDKGSILCTHERSLSDCGSSSSMRDSTLECSSRSERVCCILLRTAYLDTQGARPAGVTARTDSSSSDKIRQGFDGHLLMKKDKFL